MKESQKLFLLAGLWLTLCFILPSKCASRSSRKIESQTNTELREVSKDNRNETLRRFVELAHNENFTQTRKVRETIRNNKQLQSEFMESLIQDIAETEPEFFPEELLRIQRILKVEPDLINIKVSEHNATLLHLAAETNFTNGQQLALLEKAPTSR